MRCQMMTAAECRAKAIEAVEFARQAPDESGMLAWQGVVEDWLTLEKMAARQDNLALQSS